MNDKLKLILEKANPLVKEGHFLYPADTHGPYFHLPSFFYFQKVVAWPDAALLIAQDLANWVKLKNVPVDFIFAPQDPAVIKVVEKLSEILEKPAAYLEYLPSGRFGEKISRENLLQPGKNALVFNGVSSTGRCVGERLPGFANKFGAHVAAISVFAKGTASGVKKAEEEFGDKFYSAIQVDLPLYSPEECPLCKKGIPLKPWNATK